MAEVYPIYKAEKKEDMATGPYPELQTMPTFFINLCMDLLKV